VTPEPDQVRQAAADPSQDAAILDGDPVATQRDAAADQAGPRRVPSKTPHLAWLEILETGVAELDAWHRQLVNDCNRLLELIANRVLWIQVVAATALLAAKLMDHFRFEEEVMERNGFPRQESHAAEHRRIESQLTDLLAQIKEVDGSQEEHLVLPTAFKSILIDVMVRHDLDYRSHLLYRLGR
jgi:hemerythrin